MRIAATFAHFKCMKFLESNLSKGWKYTIKKKPSNCGKNNYPKQQNAYIQIA